MPPLTQSVRKAIAKGLETVGFRVYLTADQDNLTGDSWNKLNLNSADFDTGQSFDTTTHIFTVPVTGLYHVTANVEFNDVIADKRYGLGLYKNTVLAKEGYNHSSLAANLSVAFSDYFYLIEDDTIELYAKPEVGSGVNTVDVSSGSTTTFLSMRLVTKEGIRQ